ncbi:MAG: antitoxin family protein [Fimbriimonadales bacterium]|nr:MAG: hypothetical protein KatS3mg018_0526 [Fimbriimonadales bacterium]
MSITVEAKYEGQRIVLENPLDLPDGQRVRVTIEPIDSPTIGQQIVAKWRAAGVIGAWAHRNPSRESTRWARQLRRRAGRQTR